MLVKKTIEEQIKMIEESGDLIVLDVTKFGNFVVLDVNKLHEETWKDDTKTEKSGKTVLDHINTDIEWKKYHPILRARGIIP